MTYDVSHKPRQIESRGKSTQGIVSSVIVSKISTLEQRYLKNNQNIVIESSKWEICHTSLHVRKIMPYT